MKKDFLWGVATASAQIEGAYLEDGKCLTIWDDVIAKNNDTCHEAIDFYHRYKEDILLVKNLGINAFRFSFSWARIINENGEVNSKGIIFYKKLVSFMKENGIIPLATLYHWDLPKWVHNLGGWESEQIIPLFEKYASVVAKEFIDDIDYWFIFNEPQIFIKCGYFEGTSAPFIKRPDKIRDISLIALKAHKKAVEAIRRVGNKNTKIGIAVANSINIPNNFDNIEELKLAKEKTFDSYYGKLWHSWFLDPLLLNKAIKLDDEQYINEEDLKDIYSPLDFIGINYYCPNADEDYIPLDEHKTVTQWYVDERGLYWVCKYYSERYNMPLMISENGFAEKDELINDEVHDSLRCKELLRYLTTLEKVMSEGIEVWGYLYWSAYDNFEWCSGYTPRFGLIYIDYQTQKRILKDSAFTYRDYILKHQN